MKYLIGFISFIVITTLGLYSFLTYWPRPDDTTPAWVYASDGASLNYCNIPELDGNGLVAADIPKAYTPGCRYETMPMPVLRNCREPLAENVKDMRGLWLAESGLEGHIERIEQCGNRMVVTSVGILHDFVMDGTLENGARDIQPPCLNFATAIRVDEEGTVIFKLFGLFDAVTRKMDGDKLIFTYIDGTPTRMKRVCYLPEESTGMFQPNS